jgi:hypothetical protein
MAKDRDEDIREVMKEDKARGSRPPKSAEARGATSGGEKLLEVGTEEDVKTYIRAERIPLALPPP